MSAKEHEGNNQPIAPDDLNGMLDPDSGKISRAQQGVATREMALMRLEKVKKQSQVAGK